LGPGPARENMNRRWMVVAGALVCALAAGAPVRAQDDLDKAPRITLADAKKAIDARKVVVVDVRMPEQYAQGHIPGAMLIYQPEVVKRAAELLKLKKPIITYCA
jgi:3-mercaptopyruvate sulfurtransferase SseA